MCGIAGIISSKTDLHDLDLMLAQLDHRGPDGFGTYKDSQAAIGSSRLAIVDIQGGNQPVTNTSEDVFLVFNGEVYNYVELREELKKKGHTFRTRSDAEVILHCYLEYGNSFGAYLNGQFSIAIWDQRRHRLVLVRDRMGVRPLFFYQGNDLFAFASEIKSLFVLPRIPRELNLKALDQLFTFWTPIGNHTFFKNIEELLPGHTLIFENEKKTIVPYWAWPFPSLQNKPDRSTRGTEEEFVARLQKAVDFRLRSDVEVGAYLSGGIDSSAIIALASRSLKGNLKTFSVSFEDETYDEQKSQKLISGLFKTRHADITCSGGDIAESFQEVIEHTEAPIFRTAPAPLFLLSKLVHEKGIKVVLSGEGADEILLGYDLFRELKIRKFWARQPESEWRPLLLKKIYAYLPHFQNPRYANLAIQSFKANLHDASPFYSHLVRWNNQALNKIYFSGDAHQMLQGYNAMSELKSFLPEGYDKADTVDQAQYLELITLLKGYLLSSQGDRMAMAHSVETRFPFLDHEFIEYANALPVQAKLKGLRDKRILRNSMKNILPDSICSRPKFAFQAPEIRAFMGRGGECSSMVLNFMNREAIQKSRIYDWDMVETLLKKIRKSSLDRLGMRDNSAFVQILSTQIFYAQFFEQDFRRLAEEKLKTLKTKFFVRLGAGKTVPC
ncbi:MAG: asparagine synthase (glutamine-hydrolyzing) [Candidatus Omnitrophica bacterium]|nr:asparagine synthase (glutamine-hydrolyzing) [Candidatus Omnitrophota bacterium]